MAYLYRHIRLDKNEPFYIGIGKDENGKFKRANNRASRNIIWKRIVAKAGYVIEIMMEGLSWEEAQRKEREFIALYGRISDGGILANITIGGDGHTGMYGALNPKFGVVVSEDTKAKMKLSFQKTIANIPHTWIKKKQPKIYSDKYVWNRGRKMTGEEYVLHCARRKHLEKPVVALDVYGRFCFHFKSIAEAAKELGVHKGNVSSACKGKRGRGGKVVKTYRELIWKYKSEFPDEQTIYDWTIKLFKASTDCPT